MFAELISSTDLLREEFNGEQMRQGKKYNENRYEQEI